MNRWAPWILGWTLVTAPGGGDPDSFIIFFTPDSPGTAAIFREARATGSPVRPALLVPRWEAAPPDSFIEVVRAANTPISVYDRAALDLARTLSLHELPAVVLIRNRRFHIMTGSRASPLEVHRCR